MCLNISNRISFLYILHLKERLELVRQLTVVLIKTLNKNFNHLLGNFSISLCVTCRKPFKITCRYNSFKLSNICVYTQNKRDHRHFYCLKYFGLNNKIFFVGNEIFIISVMLIRWQSCVIGIGIVMNNIFFTNKL